MLKVKEKIFPFNTNVDKTSLTDSNNVKKLHYSLDVNDKERRDEQLRLTRDECFTTGT